VIALVGRSSSLSMHKFVLSKKLTKLTYKNKVCVLAGPAVLSCMLMHAPMLRSFIHSSKHTDPTCGARQEAAGARPS